MKYVTTVDDQEYTIEILDEHHVIIDGEVVEIDFEAVSDQPVYSLILNGQSFETHVYPEDGSWQVLLLGEMYVAQVEDEREKRLRAALGGMVAEKEEFHLRAPMPGLVVEVPVCEGQPVQKGDVLVILESMKMQNELRSPRPGIVARLRVAEGDRVEKKDPLMSVV